MHIDSLPLQLTLQLLDDTFTEAGGTISTSASELPQDQVSLEVIWSRLNVSKQGRPHRVNDWIEMLDQALDCLLRILQVLTRRSDLDIAKIDLHVDSSINQLLDYRRAREVGLERIKHKTHLEPTVTFTIEGPVGSLDNAILVCLSGIIFLLFWS